MDGRCLRVARFDIMIIILHNNNNRHFVCLSICRLKEKIIFLITFLFEKEKFIFILFKLFILKVYLFLADSTQIRRAALCKK